MYKNFTPTSDGGFALKKQGMTSIVIISGIFVAIGIFCLIILPNKLLGFFLLFLGGIGFWRITKQFIIYPSQKLFKYSKGVGFGFQEFAFDELEGASTDSMKSMETGMSLSNVLKLEFEQNGKHKHIMLGQNISAQKIRSINEEIYQIMELK